EPRPDLPPGAVRVVESVQEQDGWPLSRLGPVQRDLAQMKVLMLLLERRGRPNHRRSPSLRRRQARAHQTNSASGWLYGQREAAVERWRRLSSDSPRIRWTPCSSARRESDPGSGGDAR